MIAGIIGMGTVGKAVTHGLSFYHNVLTWDKYNPELSSVKSFNELIKSGVILICVPTPLDGNRLDMSEVIYVLDKLDKLNYHGVVAIKSTLKIGAMQLFEDKYNLRLVYTPEFLRENSSLQFFLNPPGRLVFSGKQQDIRVILDLFKWCEVKKVVMDHKSAEVMKLAHNAMFATKVSFTNEINKICNELGACPKKVMEAIADDPRNGPYFLDPTIGPYDGKCLRKDTLELINSSNDNYVLEAVHRRNEEILRSKVMVDV